jgi:mRNA interferase RelE/StbE
VSREVRATATAARALAALPADVRRRVLAAVMDLAADPLAGKPLKGALAGLRSLRIGQYRIVYSVDKEQILIRAVGHRRDIYRS